MDILQNNPTTWSKWTSVVLTTGVPGAGKSTLAARLVAEFGYEQLELDELRAELGDRADQSLTPAAVALRDERLAAAIAAGRKVVVSDTNAHFPFRVALIRDILSLGVPADEIAIVHFNADVDEAKRRNRGRASEVPEAVIDRMAAALEAAQPSLDAELYGLQYHETEL